MLHSWVKTIYVHIHGIFMEEISYFQIICQIKSSKQRTGGCNSDINSYMDFCLKNCCYVEDLSNFL